MALHKYSKRIANGINTHNGCIEGFEMTTKTLAMEGITVIFKETLKEHEVIIVVKYSRNILQAGIVHPTIHIWK